MDNQNSFFQGDSSNEDTDKNGSTEKKAKLKILEENVDSFKIKRVSSLPDEEYFRKYDHKSVYPIPIFISKRIEKEILNHALEGCPPPGPRKPWEVAGMLVGNFCATQDGQKFLKIDGNIRYQKAKGNLYQIEITPEVTSRALDELREDFPDKDCVGWYHSHPGHSVFLSEDDLAVHRMHYLKHQIAYVVDPLAKEAGFFGWNNMKNEEGPIKIEKYDISGIVPPDSPKPKPREYSQLIKYASMSLITVLLATFIYFLTKTEPPSPVTTITAKKEVNTNIPTAPVNKEKPSKPQENQITSSIPDQELQTQKTDLQPQTVETSQQQQTTQTEQEQQTVPTVQRPNKEYTQQQKDSILAQKEPSISDNLLISSPPIEEKADQFEIKYANTGSGQIIHTKWLDTNSEGAYLFTTYRIEYKGIYQRTAAETTINLIKFHLAKTNNKITNLDIFFPKQREKDIVVKLKWSASNNDDEIRVYLSKDYNIKKSNGNDITIKKIVQNVKKNTIKLEFQNEIVQSILKDKIYTYACTYFCSSSPKTNLLLKQIKVVMCDKFTGEALKVNMLDFANFKVIKDEKRNRVWVFVDFESLPNNDLKFKSNLLNDNLDEKSKDQDIKEIIFKSQTKILK